MEVYCCKSGGINLHECKDTEEYHDGDRALVVSRAKFRPDAWFFPRVWDGQVMRNVAHKYVNKCVLVPFITCAHSDVCSELVLRFTVCRVNGTQNDCEGRCVICHAVMPVEVVSSPFGVYAQDCKEVRRLHVGRRCA